MPEFKITINLERIISAENEDEVLANWEDELATSNETLLTHILEEAKITKL